MINNKGITKCTGCSACIVACKRNCIKVEVNEDGFKNHIVNMDGCDKCNACRLYCPIYFPVDLPQFEQYYEDNGQIYDRDMPTVYRETMRKIKAGEHTEFAGTLCQIAGLKALLGDKLPQRLFLFPIACDVSNPKTKACESCPFYK